ncbi:hypothetical protein U1Q18_051655, partial [Sarracenia purpurea var. burkii]
MGVRPIREGRALLKSGIGLVAVVNRQKDDDLLPVIEAHCMRCKVNETPHKIDITFKNINCQELGDFMEVEQAECSCTAASGTCKHIVATLMYLEKTGIDHIDTELSPTDLKQKWGQNKANKPRDWDKKIGSSIFQKFSGTADMKYGVENEPIALALFQKQNPDSEIVTGAGIIVNENCPWFAYSPDGFEITIDNEFYLLEVKCPSNGKEFGNAEQLSKTSFLKYDEENHTFYLRNPNRYYTQ